MEEGTDEGIERERRKRITERGKGKESGESQKKKDWKN
jgi:hypothetical protein